MAMKIGKPFYTWWIALVWAVVCCASFYHPGNEYMLWTMGSAPGLWGAMWHGDQGDIHGLLLPVLGAGALTVLLLGLILDLMRVSRGWFFVAWPVVTVALFTAVMVFADRPLQRSHTVTDGLISYSLAAINVALFFTIVFGLVGTLCGWAVAKAARILKRRSGNHPHPQAAKP